MAFLTLVALTAARPKPLAGGSAVLCTTAAVSILPLLIAAAAGITGLAGVGNYSKQSSKFNNALYLYRSRWICVSSESSTPRSNCVGSRMINVLYVLLNMIMISDLKKVNISKNSVFLY